MQLLIPFFFAVAALMAQAVSADDTYSQIAFDTQPLQQLLLQGDFARLDHELTILQDAVDNGAGDELVVEKAFSIFCGNDPQIPVQLEQWQAQMQNSFAMHLALGVYHSTVGWSAYKVRIGEEKAAWAEDVRTPFKKAYRHLDAAIKARPKNALAYATLIRMAAAIGERDMLGGYAGSALRQVPDSFLIRRTLLWSLQPKWGGSQRLMNQVLEGSKAYYESNPRLRELPDYLKSLNVEQSAGGRYQLNS